ncbi:ABC-2 type transport system ATP-binding protein [Amycolatopsis marina]|uniref:ABC-2 type transport system ATP-binding protein n=1 Tax=Amycolatopsis marina TaxID=490629 RepID=A0A1I0WWQ5_9PSEU|nr:ABC transporter ATP-binding protein [Amycolatopsis marina]SFA93232.1 ABC-2 type transport system ATP-binding protein [Amycolatopsis marina]
MTERLSVRGATRVFGPDAGLFGLDLTVAAGEVHALVGLNGAGKTTLMRAILGMLRLTDGGSVHIDGVPLHRVSPGVWRRVGHLVDHPFAYPELDTRTNLTLAARLNGVGAASAPGTADAAIAELDLGRYAAVRARRLSQGNRQRLGLAAALQHHPAVIVLDEPTNALDPAGVILLRETLLRRVGDGAGVLVSSHHLDEVARIAHRVSVLNHGRIVGVLDPDTPDLERAFFDSVHADDEQRKS